MHGAAALIALALLGFASCASPGRPAPVYLGEDFESPEEQASESAFTQYVEDNLPSFTTFKLSNGIPVIVKSNPSSHVAHILLVIRGGSLVASRESAGTESLALKTMARGSRSYPHRELQALLDETSTSIKVSTSLEASYYSLNTLDKYLKRTLPAWAETLSAPALEKADFTQMVTQARLGLESRARDPWSRTTDLANAAFFRGHPFSVDPEGSLESIENVKLESVKAWYSTAFSANRMFVVAVGKLDPWKLRWDLEWGLGRIPDRLFPLPAAAPAFVPEDEGLQTFPFPQAKGVGYVLGNFAAPGPSHPDYLPLRLSMMMFEDLLNAIVRDKYGAVYTPGAYIRSRAANFGTIAMFKTSSPGKIKAYIDEAAASMAAGEVATDDPEAKHGENRRTSLEDALPMYKALLEGQLYESWRSNASVATRIAESMIASGNSADYLLQAESLPDVTAAQVAAAFRKYVLEGRISWVALATPALLQSVNAGDYIRMGKR